MLILREAFRLNVMPKFDVIKSKKITIEQLKEKIMVKSKNHLHNLMLFLES